MRKFFLSLVAVALATAPLVACGSKEEESEALPPAKVTPDSSKPPASDNPGGAAPSGAL